MKAKYLIGLGILALIFFYGVSVNNSLVSQEENVNSAWAQVENQYQRRADLIPNLVATVQGAANFEQETQTKIAELRTAANAAKQNWDNASSQEEKIAAARQIESVAGQFSGLNINVERYPQLNAVNNFSKLQSELEGTENRVTVARMRYNQAAQSFNTKVRRFPASIIASITGFEQKEYFQADQGAQEAPEVNFGN